ncbi:SusC/RagA family TonB-linked outer membrane protein [Chryseobacterium indologenes]|uniref:SusC/RagA family TonB-linked outer membrane protein n=1 Tax=Chryseobacterium indologenes TaxID=253 RepID=UPI0023E8BB93|nr:SusC/RagA family TonB-linked outer membrane protein [Chryseobacterium indologenes]WET49539.1 SusC/RagA family TonB-linked outer membrane protein [Chryseobacterium indologenes]
MKNFTTVLKIAPAFLLASTVIHAQTKDSITNEKKIDEVVLIGYGKQKKTDLTGSITALSTADFNKGAVTTAEGLINGRSSGLVITQSGTPGNEATIRIRGGSSLNASNDPLLVVDGLPLDGVSLSTINPNDIESFSILKDAASTAIYGSRGSNGVILITTKKGGKKLRVSLNAFTTVNTLAKKIDVYSGDEFRNIINQYVPGKANLLGGANTDWQKEIFKTSVTTDINASVSGSLFGRVPSRFSIDNMDNSGLLITSQFRRTTANIALSPSFFDDHLKFNITGTYSYTFQNKASEDAIKNALSYDPTKPVFDSASPFGGYTEWTRYDMIDGVKVPKSYGTSNPVSMLRNKHDVQNFRRFFGNISMDYKFHFLPDLRLIVNAGLDSKELDGHVVTNKYSRTGYFSVNNVFNFYGEDSYSDESILNKNANVQLNYTKTFGKFNLEAMGGYEYQNYHKVSSASGNTLLYALDPTNNFYNPDSKPDVNLQAFFGRLNLGYANKYLLTINYRRDGSSRFSKNNRWGNFGGIAAAWKISEEDFLKGNSSISDLKLRASVGKTGQQDIGVYRYDYFKTYNTSTTLYYQFGNQFYEIAKANGYNQNLKWEESLKYNIGLDFGFLNNRIKGTLDFYLADTKDLLSIVPEGPLENLRIIGPKNIGKLQSRGIDLGLDIKAVKNENFTLNFNYNLSYNKVNIKQLEVNGIDKGGVGLGGFVQTFREGYSPYAFWVYQQVYDANGKPVEGAYVDRNGDGQITSADKYNYKKPQADVTMGLMTNATFGKNWDFSMGWRMSLGNYIYDQISSDRAHLGNINNTVDNTINNSPLDFNTTHFIEPQKMSDYYVKNGSFLKLDNVTVGYTFNRFIGNNASLRLYVAAQNVLTITKYKNIDPEIFNNGVDNSIYPRARMFTLGINANF